MSKIESSFYQKIRVKYKLSVLNENTLEEVWRMRLSKLNVFLISFIVAVLYFLLIAFFIIKTPLRGFLPGYTENINLRKQVMLDAVRVDSIMEVMTEQHQYVAVLQKVMAGEVAVDSLATIDSLLRQEKNVKANLESTKNEVEFRSEFEETEKYNISAIDYNRPTEMNYLMHRPARGFISKKFDEKNRNFGVSVFMEPKSNVYSLLDGVVIFEGFSVNDNLFVMQIQHVDDIVSVYKIKQPFLKKVGDEVHAGEILTTFIDENINPELFFELWKKGKSLNPEDYVIFH